MEIDIFTYNCTGCGKCVTCCPCGCFTLVDNGSCRFVNIIAADLCIGCKLCEQHCPNNVIKIERTKKDKIMNVWKLRAKFMLNCHVVMELACSVHNGMEQYQLLAGFRTDASIPLLKREYTSSDVSH